MCLLGILCLVGMEIKSVANNDNEEFKTRFPAKQLKNAPVKLIPYPQKVEWGKSEFFVKYLWINNFKSVSKLLKDELYRISSDNGIELKFGAKFLVEFRNDNSIPKEGYKLNVSKDNIIITSSSESGHYYGLKTLRQLIRFDGFKSYVHECAITDSPKYSIRGYMIDVGRNFQSIKSIKKQLDIMSQYKLNVFHWHLTDSPSWRVESKIFPQLNLPQNHRATRDPGMYYSFDEIREVIRYANDRHITVIPELDMPGHSSYFKTTFGFKMESEKGMIVLEALLKEFFDQIPLEMAPMIHLGSDEVHIPNPEEFVSKMVDIVENNGRKAIIWHPGLQAKKSVIRQIWGGKKPLPASGLTEIDSDMNYINVGEPMSHIPSLFFKPIGQNSNNNTIGGIICLWPDVNIVGDNDIIKQNPLYSSLLTYAWTTWTADVVSASDRYNLKLPDVKTKAYNYFKAFEEFLLDHKHRYFMNEPFQYVKQSDKHWKIIGPFKNDEGDKVISQIDKKSYKYNGKKIKWDKVTGNTIILNHPWKKNAHYPKTKAGNTVYASTYIKSDKDRKVPVWIAFDSPSRNYRGRIGVASDGDFDDRRSTVWINDVKIKGPKWNTPLNYVKDKNEKRGLREIPWAKDELYWNRKPTTIHLKKGVNKVLIKAPKKHDGGYWMFTFAVLEQEGLTFSTEK